MKLIKYKARYITSQWRQSNQDEAIQEEAIRWTSEPPHCTNQKCQDKPKLLREKSDSKVLYFKCPLCGSKYKAERILQQRHIIKISLGSADPPEIFSIMKPIYDSLLENDIIRDQLNLDSDHDYEIEDHKLRAIPKRKIPDNELRQRIAQKLFVDEHTQYNGYPNDSNKQNEIINEIDKVIDMALSQDNQKELLRILFFAAMQYDNDNRNKHLAGESIREEYISTSVKPIATKKLKKRQL